MIVLSADSGYGSGISTYNTLTGEFHTEEVHEFIPACQRFFAILAEDEQFEVVAENFVVTQYTAKLSGQNESLRLNGVLEWLAFNRGAKFTLQMPSARKPGEAKLKLMGWHRKTKNGHSNSASGHLLVYLLKHDLLRPEEKLRILGSLL